MKELLKLWIPPILLQVFRNLNPKGIRFIGKYSSWEEANANADGYDSEGILEKIKSASLKVKNGDASCERDAVLFDVPQYAWPSLACLMHVAACEKGRLSVLDFGGSLGSSYFLNRNFLHGLSVEWSIVEQPHFVEFGKQEIADDILLFYKDIDECLLERTPNCLFLSSVLQYLEDPYRWLEIFVNLDIDYIVLDRMPFSKTQTEFIQIQEVPTTIYKASYPLHILCKDSVIDFMNLAGFRLIEAFAPDVGIETNDFYPHGLFFKRLEV